MCEEEIGAGDGEPVLMFDQRIAAKPFVSLGVVAWVLHLLAMPGVCATSKHDPWSLGPHASLTATYEGHEPEQKLVCPRSVRYPGIAPATPLIGRVGGAGEEIRLDRPCPDQGDGVLAYRLAEIAHQLLQEEAAMNTPAIYVLLFPVSRMGAFRIEVPLATMPGVAVGVPSLNGELNPRHALGLLHLMVHESTEMSMVYPAIGCGARLYGDPRNRWVGEGMANLMAAEAIDKAVDRDLEIAACGFPSRLLARDQGENPSIRLADWLPGQADHGRYAAAEYLCYLWYQAARGRGHERPIAEFATWLRGYPKGPRHSQVLNWLHETSGIDMKEYSKRVPVREVLEYHRTRWLNRGWNPPTRVSEIE